MSIYYKVFYPRYQKQKAFNNFYEVRITEVNTTHNCKLSHYSFRVAKRISTNTKKIELNALNVVAQCLKLDPYLPSLHLRPLLASCHSLNINLSIDFIENFPISYWHWYTLSSHPNTTLEIIEKYPDTLRDWNGISCNPNITFEFIEKNNDKPWDRNGISSNKFTKEKNNFIIEEVKKYLVGVKINNFIFECYFSPCTLVGKKRFKKEYDALFAQN